MRLRIGPLRQTGNSRPHSKEDNMPKGQQKSNKEGKKPKKDSTPAKPVSPDAVRPTATTVVPIRGKLKK